jgi:hypothetical protein
VEAGEVVERRVTSRVVLDLVAGAGAADDASHATDVAVGHSVGAAYWTLVPQLPRARRVAHALWHAVSHPALFPFWASHARA